MIPEILERFEKNLEKNPDIVIDSYELKEGLYVKLSESNCKSFIVKKTCVCEKDKKKIYENILYKENGEQATSDDKNWFKDRDYLSSIWTTNKVVLDMKIHNCNYLTLFFKVENLDYVFGKLKEQINVFKNFAKFGKKDEKEILSRYGNYFADESRQQEIDRTYDIFSKNAENIRNLTGKITKGYVKIYLDKEIELYEKESKIYIDLKIFNVNEFNFKVNNEIYGLSAFNMGLNSKKPYLEHKSRKNSIPYAISQSEIFKEKALFDWLSYNQNSKIDDFDRIFMRKFNNNGSAVINDFDYIPLGIDDYKFEKFLLKEFIKIKDEKDETIEIIKDFDSFKAIIHQYLYQNQLFNNIFNDGIKVSSFISKDLQTLLYQTKDAVAEYFYKFNDDAFDYIIKKYSADFIKVALQNEKYGELNAKKAINFIFSYKLYKGENMDLDQIYDCLGKALSDESITKLDNKNTYMFLAGEVAMCLMSKSKANKKTFSLAEPYLKAKKVSKLKDALKVEFDRYKHEIFIFDEKFKKAYMLVQNFDGDVRIDSDMESLLIAGMMSKSLIYKKGE